MGLFKAMKHAACPSWLCLHWSSIWWKFLSSSYGRWTIIKHIWFSVVSFYWNLPRARRINLSYLRMLALVPGIRSSRLRSPAKNETIKVKEFLFIPDGNETISKLRSICLSRLIGLKMRKSSYSTQVSYKEYLKYD